MSNLSLKKKYLLSLISSFFSSSVNSSSSSSSGVGSIVEAIEEIVVDIIWVTFVLSSSSRFFFKPLKKKSKNVFCHLPAKSMSGGKTVIVKIAKMSPINEETYPPIERSKTAPNFFTVNMLYNNYLTMNDYE